MCVFCKVPPNKDWNVCFFCKVPPNIHKMYEITFWPMWQLEIIIMANVLCVVGFRSEKCEIGKYNGKWEMKILMESSKGSVPHIIGAHQDWGHVLYEKFMKNRYECLSFCLCFLAVNRKCMYVCVGIFTLKPTKRQDNLAN